MSLKSTTSLHSMLNRITNSAHRGAAEARILTKLQEEEERVLEYNDYNLNDTQVDYLAQMGINSSPSGWKSHPHVIHKIIENFILFEHVRWLIKTDYTCAFMKGEKFAKLASKIPKFKGVLRNAVLSVEDTAKNSMSSRHLHAKAQALHTTLDSYEKEFPLPKPSPTKPVRSSFVDRILRQYEDAQTSKEQKLDDSVIEIHSEVVPEDSQSRPDDTDLFSVCSESTDC